MKDDLFELLGDCLDPEQNLAELREIEDELRNEVEDEYEDELDEKVNAEGYYEELKFQKYRDEHLSWGKA